MGLEGAGKKFPFIVVKCLVLSSSLTAIRKVFIFLCFKPQCGVNTMPKEIIYLRLMAYFYLI